MTSEVFDQISSKSRVRQQLRGLMEILAGEPEGLHKNALMKRLKEVLPPTELENTLNPSGVLRYDTNAGWWSTDLVKAGWLVKDNGVWTITEAGREALRDYPDFEEFGQVAADLYNAWKAQSEAEKADRQIAETWALADAVIARIPEGRWATFGDLADAVGVAHQQLGVHVWQAQPQGWHRLARAGGWLTAEAYGVEDRTDEQRALLAEEGFEDSRALPSDRALGRGDLAGLVAELKGGDRAWFIRGTSVHGASVVPEWLSAAFVSLPASMLPELVFPTDDAAIKSAVDSGYSTLGYSQREAKYEEIRAFVRRMRSGDLVLTTNGDEVFFGRVAGGPEQLASPGKRSNLRRTVEWLDADSPLAVDEVSPRVQSRLGSPSDIVELTDLLDELETLQRLAVNPEDSADPAEALSAAEINLPDLALEAVEKLLIDPAWLAEFVELLRMKKQVILYGPPGTGKTFLAQEVAEALAGKGHVTLVQFHPSYAYEDFFEGYRPAGTSDGGVSLQLVPGPFRKVVDLARANPTEPYFLIIDEINRANLAKVFGELYFLLEYRDRSIELLYSSGDTGPAFSLPVNVYIIGTMNTADRSIALVDAAMRRRFAFLSLHPEDEKLDLVLRAWLAERGLPEERADLLVELNRRITDKDFKIGPSYLMNQWAADDAGLDRIWRTSILPLLAEYHIGDGVDVDAKYGLAGIRKALGAVGSEATAGHGEPE